MARTPLLPSNLSPDQVVALQDALLANADRLLRASVSLLDAGDVALARRPDDTASPDDVR